MNATNKYIEDAKSLMRTADACDTSAEQAARLYCQAAKILRAIPSETLSVQERITAQNLADECDACAITIIENN